MGSTTDMVLLGTKDELQSYRCLMILCTAIKTGTPLTRKITSSFPSPLSKSLCLTLPHPTTLLPTHIPTLPTILRTLATLSPGSALYGSAETIVPGQIDSWISHFCTAVETPLLALSHAPDHDLAPAVTKDITAAAEVLERHLVTRTYLVGEGVTLAYVVGACLWKEAKERGVYEPPEGSGLRRWYETITRQEFFAKGVAGLAGMGRVGPSVGGGDACGAPPVKPSLFKRTRVRVADLLLSSPSVIGTTVTVKGWARTTRNANKGALLFVELNDGSCGASLQCVLDSATTEGFEEAKGCGGAGASFECIGEVVESPAKGQAIELHVKKSILLGPVYGGDATGTKIGAAMYPLSKKAHTLEHMRGLAHLRPRARLHAAAMRVRHAMAYATHKFFNDLGFLYIHTPIITCADCEGAGEQFGVTTLLGKESGEVGVKLPLIEPPKEEEAKPLSKNEKKRLEKLKKQGKLKEDEHAEEKVVGAIDYSKDFFSRRANLTVSGQLNVETHCCALSDVYTFGPTFRAENSHTARHLAEFWMIEPEVAFADLTTDINLAEDYLKYCVEYAMEMCAEDLEFFENSPFGEKGLRDRLRNVLAEPFKRLTYTEGIEILQEAVASGDAKFEEKAEWGIDLPTEMERYLCETKFKKPVVLTDYPKGIKAFYMKLNEDNKTVAAADILVPKIGEIIGGSQREHRLDVLKERCIESGLDPKHVWWYLDLRKYGTIPHAGFGLGFERLIMFVTGLDNIRDVIPFPRWPGNAEF